VASKRIVDPDRHDDNDKHKGQPDETECLLAARRTGSGDAYDESEDGQSGQKAA
jgi:hypothetical protein